MSDVAARTEPTHWIWYVTFPETVFLTHLFVPVLQFPLQVHLPLLSLIQPFVEV